MSVQIRLGVFIKLGEIVKRVVIRGSEWLRNSSNVQNWRTYSPQLLDFKGRKCCLGIAASACNIKDWEIMNVPTPIEVKNINECFLPWVNDQILADEAMTINDSGSTDDEYKIETLRPLFNRANMTIVWRPDL